MEKIVPITISYGDGIGPEIMESCLKILKEAKAPLRFEAVEIGKKVFDKYGTTGISEDNILNIKNTKILLKAPTTTPQGKGFRSVNVELRKYLGLYANIRPSISYYPIIPTPHPKMNVVIIRENEEDLYSGIEYKQTNNLSEAIKITSNTGSEKIIRYAFEYGVKNNRKKICCFSKDNIMKISEGIFHEIFDKIALEYKGLLDSKHYIVDIGTALLAKKPEDFDIIVTSNLFGDIISDVTAELSSSVGMAGSANIGTQYAMFEAIHGSAPDIAGQNIANPSGIINAAIMMLKHVEKYSIANLIENALNKTLEDGIHTQDIYNTKNSTKKASTEEFTQAVIKRLGQYPKMLPVANLTNQKNHSSKNFIIKIPEKKKEFTGMDIYLDFKSYSAEYIATKINDTIKKEYHLRLDAIFSKGLKIWPVRLNTELSEISDHWCCRFLLLSPTPSNQILANLIKITEIFSQNEEFQITKIVNLYKFDDKNGFFNA